MANDPFQLLRQPGSSVPSTELTNIGKHASYLYLRDGVPLNDAVIKVAQEHPGITSEQVKRVIEYANQHTFQFLFEKNAGAEDQKNIDFPIADPHEVLRRLNDGASPPIMKTAASEYFQRPATSRAKEIDYDVKLASIFGVELAMTPAMEKAAGTPFLEQDRPKKVKEIYSALKREHPEMPAGKKARIASSKGKTASVLDGEQSFKEVLAQVNGTAPPPPSDFAKFASAHLRAGGDDADLVQSDLEKMASLDSIKQATSGRPDYPMANPLGELTRARWQLDKLAEEAKAAKEINEENIKIAEAEFHRELRQHLLGGGGLGEVVHALAGMSSPELVKSAMDTFQPALTKLASEHRINLVKLQSDAIQYEMTKTAHRIANPENPIIRAYAGYMKLAQGQRVLDRSYLDIEDLQKKAHALTAKAAR